MPRECHARSMVENSNNIRSLEAIAARLICARAALEMSQSEFADTAEIARNTYNQYEKSVQRISLDMAMKLCDTYDLSLDYIYFGDASGIKFQLAQKLKAHQ